MGYSVRTWVPELSIPILPESTSVNQRLPAGPAAIREAAAPAVGMGNSVMTWLAGLIMPILLLVPKLPHWYSANQRLPSGPAVIPSGRLPLPLGTESSVMAWVV